MNPRQRRGILLVALSLVLGTLAFGSVTSYASDVERQVGSKVTVFQAVRSIEAFEPLSADNLRAVEVPEQWTGPSSRVRLEELSGRKIGFKVDAETIVSRDMLVPVSELGPTQREIALNVGAVTGLAGRVRPGDEVDIYAVFDDQPGVADQVRVLVRSVPVLSVGGTQTVSEQDRETGLTRNEDVVPVTLSLGEVDALSVTFADSFAKEVRLVGLPTGDDVNRDGELDTFEAGSLAGREPPADVPAQARGGNR
jgi:pilus assembly protein CpaB